VDTGSQETGANVESMGSSIISKSRPLLVMAEFPISFCAPRRRPVTWIREYFVDVIAFTNRLWAYPSFLKRDWSCAAG